MNEKTNAVRAYRALKAKRLKHFVRQYTFGDPSMVQPVMVEKAVKAAYEAGYRDGCKSMKVVKA